MMLRPALLFIFLPLLLALSPGFATAGADESNGVKAISIIQRWNSLKQYVCGNEATPPPVVAPAKPKVTPKPKPLEPPSDEFKSEGELRRYLECYSTEEDRYDLIADKYLPLIAVSGNAFDLPKTLLACLIFRESRFDINATSYVKNKKGELVPNAHGLGQHLASTLVGISTIIKVPEPLSPKEQERIDKIKKRQEDIRQGVGRKEDEQDKKDRRFLAAKADIRWQRAHWEAYFDQLRGQKPALWKGPTPRVVTVEMLKNPAISIGATALYLQGIMIYFRKQLDEDLVVRNGDGQRPNYDTLLATAGAYNMGEGAAAKILAHIEPPDRKKWVEALAKSNQETAGHILSIRNCIESSSSKEGNAWKGPMGSANYSCDPEDLDKKRIALGEKNNLPQEYKNGFKTARMNSGKKSERKSEQKSAKKSGKSDAKTAAVSEKKPKADTKSKGLGE